MEAAFRDPTHDPAPRVRRAVSPRGVMSHGVRAALAMVTLAALAQCESSAPAIVSATPSSFEERTATVLTINTVACAPTFDLDRGMQIADPTATVRLGDAYMLTARRVRDEEFETTVPPTVPPGSYRLELTLSDGRTAVYADRVQVVAARPEITAVSSARTTVNVGERSVPLSVTVANPSQCALDGVVITPVFTRNGIDHSGYFVVSGAEPTRIAAMSVAVVEFRVDVNATSTAGNIRLDARARADQRSGGSGCSGPATVPSTAPDAEWVILSPARQSLVFHDPRATPEDVHAGNEFRFRATLTNASTVALTLETLTVQSTPAGVIMTGSATPMPARLTAGESVSYELALNTSDNVASGNYTLTAHATARDDAANLFTSGTEGASTGVSVHGGN